MNYIRIFLPFPPIVVSTAAEPLKGWLDNFNGPVGMLVGGGKGILRVLFVDPIVTSDFMPVDVAIKAIIIAAWQRGIKTYVYRYFHTIKSYINLYCYFLKR